MDKDILMVTMADDVLRTVQERGGKLFTDEIAPIIADDHDTSEDEVKESIKFLYRCGLVTLNDVPNTRK